MRRRELRGRKAGIPDLAKLSNVVIRLQEALSLSWQTRRSLELLVGCGYADFITSLEHLRLAGLVGFDERSGNWLPTGAEQLRRAIEELGGCATEVAIARHCGFEVVRLRPLLCRFIEMGIIEVKGGEFHVLDLRWAS